MKKVIILMFLTFICVVAYTQNPLDSLMLEENVKMLEKKLRIAKSKKQYKECISLLDTLISLQPKNAIYYYKQGYFYEKEGDLILYHKLLMDALELGYDSLKIYNDFYLCYMIRKEYEKALIYADELIHMQPQNGDMYLNVASIFNDKGDYVSYAKYTKKAAEKGSIKAKETIEYLKRNGTWQKYYKE